MLKKSIFQWGNQSASSKRNLRPGCANWYCNCAITNAMWRYSASVWYKQLLCKMADSMCLPCNITARLRTGNGVYEIQCSAMSMLRQTPPIPRTSTSTARRFCTRSSAIAVTPWRGRLGPQLLNLICATYKDWCTLDNAAPAAHIGAPVAVCKVHGVGLQACTKVRLLLEVAVHRNALQ